LRAGGGAGEDRLLLMGVTIWHNPKCGTSRNALAMIRATGVEPTVVEYLKTPPDAATLAKVATAVGGAAALMRVKGTPAEELGLVGADDAAILAAMAEHPILINRPVVIGPKGTILARPSEKVLEVLDSPLPADFVKEDGERVARPA
jgi:arsenate reductase